MPTPTVALQSKATHHAMDDVCSSDVGEDSFLWRRALEKDATDLRRLSATQVTLEDFIRDGFTSPLCYSLALEKATRICGMATFYLAYSTWEGRVLFLNCLLVPDEEMRQNLMLILAKIATRLDCSRLVWQHMESTRSKYEEMGAETLDGWLTLRMDRTGMDSFLASESDLASTASIDKGPMTVDAVHGAMDDSLGLVNTGLEKKGVKLTRATSSSITDIQRLVQGLADYEKESDAVNVTGDQFRLDGFDSPDPLFYCLLLKDAKTGVAFGLAFIYIGYDMDTGRFLYLEDLFIEEAYRGKGAGKMVMFALANMARTLDCSGFMWQALDWNTPALTFYDKIGGKVLEGLLTTRFAGDDLARFAQQSQQSA